MPWPPRRACRRPASRATRQPQDDLPAGVSTEEIACVLAGLSQLLASRMASAASAAPDHRDRAACAQAAWHARNIHALLSGGWP